MRSILSKSLIFLIFLVVFGCGEDTTDPVEVAPVGVGNATLSVGSIQSMGRVGVAGLPVPTVAVKAIPYEVVVAAEGAEEFNLILDIDEDGWFFNAPLHPVAPNLGGKLFVRISDGTEESANQELEVGPLPEAPGAFASLVATITEHLEQRAVMAGSSIAALKATPAAEVPGSLLSLKLAQAYLDSDIDPNDLTDLAANEDGFFSADEMELMDRVFGYFDLESLVRQDINDWPASDAETLIFPAATSHAGKRSPAACIEAGPEINIALHLSEAMIRSAVAQFGADPNSDAGRTLDAGATMMTGLSVVPGVGAVAAVAGATIAAVQAATEFVAGTLPSSFVSLDCQVDKTQFNEDSTEFAKYSNVEVVAASTGWSADKSIANVAVNSFGAHLSVAGKGQILGSELAGNVTGIGVGAGAAGVFDGSGIIEFCAQQWTVDISDPQYCTAAALNRKFEVDIEAQTVTPREDGSDQLQVAAQPSKFGRREVSLDTPMSVDRIIVAVTPTSYTVDEPGETVMITAAISNADLTTLRWTPQRGSWDDGNLDDTNDGRTRPLITPTNPDDYPFIVSVESLTRNGIRSTGQPPRIGFATIRYQDEVSVQIDPQYKCIQPGETLQYTAEVTGLDEYNVIWSVTEGYGSIDQNGLYQSLSSGSSYAVIQAVIEGHPEAVDDASLDAAACNCTLVVDIGGAASLQMGSSQAAFQAAFFGDYSYQFFFKLGDGGYPQITAAFTPLEGVASPQPGDTGSWDAGFAYLDGFSSWSSLVPDAPLPGVTMNITEFTEAYMVGSFTGNAFELNELGEVSSIISVDVQFRAGLFDGVRWPCE